jgi:hypothetical protein
MNTNELIQDLNRSEEWNLSERLSIGELEQLLSDTLNEWVRSDFNKLLLFLYRVDISESRLKELLNENTSEDAGTIMARLVLERLWQKIETRRLFKPGEYTSDEERW